MTTHALPTIDDVGQPLLAASVDGDPHDRPTPAPHDRAFPPHAFFPTPLPQRTPGAELERRDRIDQIHRLAAWFEDHPEIPAPSLVAAHSYVYDAEKLQQLAEQQGTRVYGSNPQIDVPLYADSEMRIWAYVALKLPDRPL